MILTVLTDTARYEALQPGLAAAFAWLRATDLDALPPGRQEIDGERLWVNVIHAPATPPEQGKLEVHRRYADVQYALTGGESFGWRPTGECGMPVGAFDEAADAGLFADAPTAWYPLAPGTLAIFFPEDAHAPGLGAGDLCKVVVKVLL
jgi:YhcH/YjgK/YiaL family protein